MTNDHSRIDKQPTRVYLFRSQLQPFMGNRRFIGLSVAST